MYEIEAKSLLDLLQQFPDEEACIRHLETLYSVQGVIHSPFSECSKVYKLKNHRYRCKNTGKNFNIKTRTIFENTKLPLRAWFTAIWFVTSHKKGISSYQLARDLLVTQKTAWFMLHRIRKAMGEGNGIELNGIIEIDETFVGGKNKNRHRDKKVKNSQGRSFKDKTPVIGMLERGGNLVAKVVKSTKGKYLTPVVTEYISKDAMIYTDEWHGYNKVRNIYKHDFIDHSVKQYSKGNVCTNGIEGFWSILKRGIIGIYHITPRKYLHYYVNEFVFRYNLREFSDGERFNLALYCAIKNRLTYKELTRKAA